MALSETNHTRKVASYALAPPATKWKERNYWVQLFWSKNKRFVIVVFEQDMQLPEHLDSERHRLAGAEPVNRWKLLAWAFRALKWFYRSNNTLLSLKYILEDDRLVHPIMVVVDMNKGHLKEAIVHKSVAFLELFGDLETMMHNVVRPQTYRPASWYCGNPLCSHCTVDDSLSWNARSGAPMGGTVGFGSAHVLGPANVL